jgi:hypothetical protein
MLLLLACGPSLIIIPYPLLLLVCYSLPIVAPCSSLLPTHQCSHFFGVLLAPLIVAPPCLPIVVLACVSLDDTTSSFFAFVGSLWNYKQQANSNKSCNLFIYLIFYLIIPKVLYF